MRTIRKTLFGKVVLYQDTLTHRLVAIKLSDRVLLERGTTTSGNKVAEDPQEEIRTMNILSGNLRNVQGVSRESLSEGVRRGELYVLTSLGEYEDGAYLYTVMPFCSKGEFFDLVCHETKFSEEKAKKYFLQMVLGVRYMHALGMVHLDLSLENLLMTEDDQLKVCEFEPQHHTTPAHLTQRAAPAADTRSLSHPHTAHHPPLRPVADPHLLLLLFVFLLSPVTV